MKGLIVWAQSACRSQMSLYRALGVELGVKVVVAVWFYKKTVDYVDNRNEVGFSDDEYKDMTIIPVGEDYEKGMMVLDAHPGWAHLFCNYQGSNVFRLLQLEASRRGEKTAIGSEAPCNMFSGYKRLLKELYYRTVLPRRVSKVLSVSEFIVNYSGDDDCVAKKIGWEDKKIIPFGYYPPAIPGSICRCRESNRPFSILATGSLSWHRGCDILVSALKILKDRGVRYNATITQKGPLLEKLKSLVQKYDLPVKFAGFVSLGELKELYEKCTVYVGAGRHEPWGMRLNDALNCGAPLVVSRGMGGVKMVNDYGCGLAFENENPVDLADKLQMLYDDSDLYDKCAANAIEAAYRSSPESKAKELVAVIEERFSKWITF